MTSVKVSGFEEDVKESMFNLSLKHKGQTLRSHLTLETVKDPLFAYLNKHYFCNSTKFCHFQNLCTIK